MKLCIFFGGLALPLALSACGDGGTGAAADDRASAAAEAADAVHSAAGTVTGISADEITISHGPVDSLGWPPMTMSFQAASPQLVRGIAIGDRVGFEFHESDGSYVLSSIVKQ